MASELIRRNARLGTGQRSWTSTTLHCVTASRICQHIGVGILLSEIKIDDAHIRFIEQHLLSDAQSCRARTLIISQNRKHIVTPSNCRTWRGKVARTMALVSENTSAQGLALLPSVWC